MQEELPKVSHYKMECYLNSNSNIHSYIMVSDMGPLLLSRFVSNPNRDTHYNQIYLLHHELTGIEYGIHYNHEMKTPVLPHQLDPINCLLGDSFDKIIKGIGFLQMLILNAIF